MSLTQPSDFAKLANEWRNKGLKLVFTNGCFDILHEGHIVYLEEAKALGDKLIVGLNTDESIQKIKGDKRPVNPLKSRLKVLDAIQYVDMVIPFKENTPEDLIRLIKPDVLVKGGDYEIENIAGGKFVMENGGLVKTLKFVEGVSTTEIIKKIKEI